MKKMSILLVLICSLILVGCQEKKESEKDFSQSFSSMDTNVTIHIYAQDPNFEKKETAFNDIKDIFDQLHRLTDHFEPYEDTYNIYYINEHPNSEIVIEKELYDILESALTIQKMTDGYFDISIGKIIDKWKWLVNLEEKLDDVAFANFLKEVNDIPVIEDAVTLKKENNQYSVFLKAGAKIDLGAIAKGYAVQMAQKIMAQYGITYYQIKGSDSSAFYGINAHKDRDYFRVGLLRPLSSSHSQPYYGIVNVKNQALTTSGDSIQSVFYGEIKYHHIVSPKTKRPENYYSMMTILNDDAAGGDALTTALMSMPPAVLTAFLERNKTILPVIYHFDETIDSYLSDGVFELYKG